MKQDNQKSTGVGGRNTLPSLQTDDKISIMNSPVEGNGVFAKKTLLAGERIAYFEGEIIPHITKHSLTLDGKNIDPTGELKNLNHSCDPNAYFMKRWLIAGREINEGKEVTIDYTLTEESFSYPFPCNCGSEKCRRHIR